MKFSQVCICDIIPDSTQIEHKNNNKIDITPCINSNEMYELAYWECLHKQKIWFLYLTKVFVNQAFQCYTVITF